MVMKDPEDLERENDEVIGLLAGKAQELRNVSAGIRDEARRHKDVLDKLGQGMGGADDMLRSSVAKFNKVFSSAENRILGYIVVGGIITLALFYFVFKRK